MTTRTEAVDDCMYIVQATLSTLLTIHWPGRDVEKPAADQAWARVTMHHHQEVQKTLGKYNGARHYQATGKIYVEVYLPTDHLPESDEDPAIILRDAFRVGRTQNGVALRNATAREGGLDGGWNKTVVSVDFEYDTVQSDPLIEWDDAVVPEWG